MCGKYEKLLEENIDNICSVSFSPDGKQIALNLEDCKWKSKKF